MISVAWLVLGQFWFTEDVYIPESYMESVFVNLFSFPFLILAQMFMQPFLVVILIGVWLARTEWITQPENHRSLLKKVAINGISVSVLSISPINGSVIQKVTTKNHLQQNHIPCILIIKTIKLK